MELNSVIFPSPEMNHTLSEYEEEIIYIPKIDFYNEIENEKNNENYNNSLSSNDKSKKIEFKLTSDSIKGYIPCLFLKSLKKNLLSKNFMLYFHGNAEDIFYARDIADRIRSNLPVSCLYFINDR